MHSLRYEVIIQMLQQFDYSGEAHASIAPSTLLREGGNAILVAQNGRITASMILHRNGKKLYDGTEAQYLLSRMGILEWQLVEIPASSAPLQTGITMPALPAGRVDAFYPHRVPVSSSKIHEWPKLQRSVYLLADGARSIDNIAKLLSCSKTLVEQSVHNLQLLGAIEELS